MRSLMCRRKVALFEVGDMSQSQILRRLGVRLSCRPMFRKDLGIIEVPKMLHRDGKNIEIDTVEILCEKIARAEACKKAVKRFVRRNGIKPEDPHVMFSCHPNTSVNVSDISGILDGWAIQRNFVPDIIVIDYPDILAPEPGCGHMTTKDRTNETWKALRKLSQQKHCLVVVPTQADAASYNVELLGPENFTDDRRKLDHPTGVFGLNQTKEEKAQGIMRLNWINLREDEFATDRCLYVGQQLKLGRPFCCGTY